MKWHWLVFCAFLYCHGAEKTYKQSAIGPTAQNKELAKSCALVCVKDGDPAKRIVIENSSPDQLVGAWYVCSENGSYEKKHGVKEMPLDYETVSWPSTREANATKLLIMALNTSGRADWPARLTPENYKEIFLKSGVKELVLGHDRLNKELYDKSGPQKSVLIANRSGMMCVLSPKDECPPSRHTNGENHSLSLLARPALEVCHQDECRVLLTPQTTCGQVNDMVKYMLAYRNSQDRSAHEMKCSDITYPNFSGKSFDVQLYKERNRGSSLFGRIVFGDSNKNDSLIEVCTADTLRLVNTTNQDLYFMMYAIHNTLTGYLYSIYDGPPILVRPQLSVVVPWEKGKACQRRILACRDSNFFAPCSAAGVTDLCRDLDDTRAESASADVAFLAQAMNPGTLHFLVRRIQGKYTFGPLLKTFARYKDNLLTLVANKIFKKPALDLQSHFEDRFRHVRSNKYRVVRLPDGASTNLILGAYSMLAHEENFLRQRKRLAVDAMKDIFSDRPNIAEKINEETIPRVALVFSGGGYRAMTETIGFLRGAQETGVLACALWATGLSGSAWALASWLTSGKDIMTFNSGNKQRVSRGRLIELLGQLNSEHLEQDFIDTRFGKDHDLVAKYGHSIAQALLQDLEPHHVTLADLAARIDPKLHPLCINVAIDSRHCHWYEFSPYYVGNTVEQKWIDTKLFGSRLSGGTMKVHTPPYTLAHFMGMWGSAACASPSDLSVYLGGRSQTRRKKVDQQKNEQITDSSQNKETDQDTKQKQSEVSQRNKVVDDEKSKGFFISEPVYANPFFGVDGVENRDDSFLCLKDGGLRFIDKPREHNLATVPLLYRDADVIIVCDAPMNPNSDQNCGHLRASIEESKQLSAAYSDARVRPTQELPELSKDFRMFGDGVVIPEKGEKNEGEPIVVYMKGKKTPGNTFDPDAAVAGFTDTMNFKYSSEEYDKLSGLTKAILQQNLKLIKEAFERALLARVNTLSSQ